MIFVEKHIIKPSYKFYGEIDELSFLSKNLYNKANYIIRQNYIKDETYLNYYDINRLMVDDKDIDYISLPRKVSNQTLMLLDKNWKSFFKAIKDYQVNPTKYKGKPKLLKYKDKTKGRNILIYELGAISKSKLRNGIIKLSKTNIEIPFINKEHKLKQVRIIPNDNNYYKIEIIYEKETRKIKLNPDNILGVDLGVNNLMALTSNKGDFIPLLVNGRPIKSINQYYNKLNGELKSKLPKNIYSSKKIKKITQKRNNKIDYEFHNYSKFIINLCIKNNIGTIVIGKNNGWKQESNMGKRNNQNFVTIPFNNLISQIEYKGEFTGINVIVREESYTSKASFLNLDKIPTYGDKNIDHKFGGYRKNRGLYKIKGDGKYINSDMNGSYNILRKEFPKTFVNGIEGVAVHPLRVKSKNEFHSFL